MKTSTCIATHPWAVVKSPWYELKCGTNAVGGSVNLLKGLYERQAKRFPGTDSKNGFVFSDILKLETL